MKAAIVRRWSAVHTWSSLVCTVFLLVICVTGLPLIFSAEIDRLGDAGSAYAPPATFQSVADTDAIVERARQAFPGQIVRSVYWPEDHPTVVVRLAPADNADNALDHTLTFDVRTGLEHSREEPTRHVKFMDVMGHLHEDLFLDLPGELFLGLMAVLFMAALASGVVLYAPFMRHSEFGEQRARRGSRLAWLDLHNVLGIVALAWMGIVGLTGVINELATPLFTHWLATDVGHALPPSADNSIPDMLTPVEAVMDTVQARLPGRRIETVDFPTHQFGSSRHYVAWTRGQTPLTSRIYVPAFVDAVSGQFVLAAPPPWYLWLLEVARPLHFGDYGGLPLKILWALLDVLTIIVLTSGIKLWLSRRRLLVRRREGLALQSTEPAR